MTSDDAFLKKLRVAFVEEAHEQIDHISSCLTSLQSVIDESERRNLVETVFREVHNLKGSARAVNLSHLEAVCQSLEDVLATIKRKERKLNTKTLDTLLSVVDAISGILTTFASAQEAETGTALNLQLEKLKEVEKVEKEEKEEIDNVDSLLRPLPVAPQAGSISSTSQSMPGEPAARESVRISSARLDQLLMRAEDMLSLKVMVRQQSQDLQTLDYRFNPYGREWTKLYSELRAARELVRHAEISAEHIFVGAVLTKTVDFMDWQQMQYCALTNQLAVLKKSSVANYRIANTAVDSFLEDTKRLLMMPSAVLFDMVPKMVRDLGRELGKDVEATVTGSHIQMDKRVLAQLKDPLVHILRNCVDHGIEAPDQRTTSGKRARGTISLSVKQIETNTVEIVIADDGGGINLEKIAQKAVENKLLSEETLAQMNEEEIISLIFESSFSTSDSISEISGRGLGLAIARDNIVKLGGRLIVQTIKGQGASFHIVLPVTIATFRGVLIKCAGEILVVPTNELHKVTKVRTTEIKQTELGDTITVDGRDIAIVRLDNILQLPTSAQRQQPYHLVMILHSAKQTIAFVVDDILDEQEVLVKQFSKPIVRARHLSGVTILGNGKPAAILNVGDVIKTASKFAREHKGTVSDISSRKKYILVVDDTITARMLIRTILESAGYKVKTASDGQEALTLLSEQRFDLVLTDIEMPIMNGLELTKAIKGKEALAKTRVVLITSMTDSEFRKKGEDAGADAFFVKSSFDQSNLLDVIKNLI